MKHFEKQMMKGQPKDATPPKFIAYNFNGEKEVSAIQEPNRFDGQTVLSGQRNYKVRIRQFGSGLSGSQLDFVINGETCNPNRVYQTCGTNPYSLIRLVNNAQGQMECQSRILARAKAEAAAKAVEARLAEKKITPAKKSAVTKKFAPGKIIISDKDVKADEQAEGQRERVTQGPR
jgi:hypothetical protein